MPNDFPPRRLTDAPRRAVNFEFEGTHIAAFEGDSVAAALYAAGHAVLRASAVGGTPRGVYCGMGACFDCLVEIDGVANRQACLVPVADGLRVRRMDGARALVPGEKTKTPDVTGER